MNPFEERAAWVAKIRESVSSGAIETAPRATLIEYSTWLCNPLARSTFSGGGEYEQICELVRLHMLRTMIDAFEERSKIMQRWLLFFAVLAMVATLMPYIIAPTPIFGATHSSKESASRTAQDSEQIQVPATLAPIPVQPPSTYQVEKLEPHAPSKKETP